MGNEHSSKDLQAYLFETLAHLDVLEAKLLVAAECIVALRTDSHWLTSTLTDALALAIRVSARSSEIGLREQARLAKMGVKILGRVRSDGCVLDLDGIALLTECADLMRDMLQACPRTGTDAGFASRVSTFLATLVSHARGDRTGSRSAAHPSGGQVSLLVEATVEQRQWPPLFVDSFS